MTHDELVEKVALYIRHSCDDTSPEAMAADILSLIAKELGEPTKEMKRALHDYDRDRYGESMIAEDAYKVGLAASPLMPNPERHG